MDFTIRKESRLKGAYCIDFTIRKDVLKGPLELACKVASVGASVKSKHDKVIHFDVRPSGLLVLSVEKKDIQFRVGVRVAVDQPGLFSVCLSGIKDLIKLIQDSEVRFMVDGLTVSVWGPKTNVMLIIDNAPLSDLKISEKRCSIVTSAEALYDWVQKINNLSKNKDR